MSINRFEYITEDGREVVSYAKHTFQLQDDGSTLKVFRESQSKCAIQELEWEIADLKKYILELEEAVQ